MFRHGIQVCSTSQVYLNSSFKLMENADAFYNHQYPISSFLQHIVTKIVTTLPWANVFIVNLCIELLQYIAVVRFFFF